MSISVLAKKINDIKTILSLFDFLLLNINNNKENEVVLSETEKTFITMLKFQDKH